MMGSQNPEVPDAGGVVVLRRIALVAGPLLALACYLLLPETYTDARGAAAEFPHAGRATLAMMVWMATWWMTEAVEIEVTSLLPIVAFPLLNVMPLGETMANYGADVIYLFLGGFVLALAPGLGVAPALLLVPCTMAASLAFMMPVGTPPNAIVFGTGLLTIGQMIKAGFWLNIAGIVVIVGLTRVLITVMMPGA